MRQLVALWLEQQKTSNAKILALVFSSGSGLAIWIRLSYLSRVPFHVPYTLVDHPCWMLALTFSEQGPPPAKQDGCFQGAMTAQSSAP